MILLYLIYGLSFIVLGAVLALQAIGPVRILPLRATVCLAAFALVHGTFEWVKLFILLDRRGLEIGSTEPFFFAAGLLLPASFLFLLAFGVESLVGRGRSPKSTRLLIPLLALAWSFVAMRALSGRSTWEAAVNQLEPWSRLLLCVPAGITASFGLWTPRMPHADVPAKRHSRYLRISAVILATYALLAGIDLPALGVGPSSPSAAGEFVSTWPVVILARFVCGALLAVFLSLALAVDVGRTQASLSLLQIRQDFASLVNHELRSSLQAIVSAAEMLSRTAPSAGTEKLERLARVIHSNASAMGLLLSDLSQGAVVDVRDLGMRMEPVDVREVIEEAADWFRTTANDHALEMRISDQPIRAEIDRMRIEQVLKNLLSNASKYSSPGTPIAMELSVEPSQISIAVENRGQGIQSSEIPHVFSRAYRTEAGKGRTRGAGLGLYIARAIVEAHGGRIFVDSTPDEITRFWFTLPLAASAAPPSGNGPAADGGSRTPA